MRIWKNRKRKYAWRNRIAPIERLVEERDDDVVVGMPASLEDAYITNEEAKL